MNAALTLVIGNKNYSSWSLRPWLFLKQFGVAFEEVRLPLDTPAFRNDIAQWSPSGRVPTLRHGALTVWDSLAILEYCNEAFLQGQGWPADLATRAEARSASAEMHSGFATMRAELPMNCRRQLTGFVPSAEAQRDIERVCAIWRMLRDRHGQNGAFLCGNFGIVDAMFAPVALRFRSYAVPLGDTESRYQQALLALPALQEWLAAAAEEQEAIAKYERIA